MLLEVPGYDVLEKVSENAAFRTYRGRRSDDLAPVLLKVLNRPYPNPKLLAPLWQEFETLRLLDLPGVEKAYVLENHQQWWMIVLEDTGGQPISSLQLAGCMEPEEYLNLALQLVEILAGIHSFQVIHKNISPSNISYLPATRQAWLTNFSYASLVSKDKVSVESPYKLADFLTYTSPELTGRMSRTVDYRTDYYSLGVTLYELLTGSPPFLGDAPLELVHAHLAIPPDPPEARMTPWSSSPRAFQMVSTILSKLLAKNPEDRYQTPKALQSDLQLCLKVLHSQDGRSEEETIFVPSQIDRPAELNFPQKVIGRQEEIEILTQAFQRTIHGQKEVLLVTGAGGVGKTALVNQLIRPVSEHMGFFLQGRYNPGSHLKIYTALIDILEEFCRLVLSEPASSFEGWREQIQIAVAPHGQLLTDLCPQLERVIGPQPPVKPVDEALARSRFHRVVIRFLQALCQPDHPVVIFLDDLQWMPVDAGLLWESILQAPSLDNLLVVGAYRPEEVGLNHAINSLIAEIQKAKGRITELPVENLEWPQVQMFIASALASDPAEVSELTTLLYMQTDGNPFLTMELLKSLSKDGILKFDPGDQKWSWDVKRIKEYGVAPNVIEFYVQQIAALDGESRRILQYAALLGERFKSADLLAILGKDNAGRLADSLWLAMRAELIRLLDYNYHTLAKINEETTGKQANDLPLADWRLAPSLADMLGEQIFFEFMDDHARQAAIAMLDEPQIRRMSLEIGWSLLEIYEQADQEALQENLLAIMDHLNKGSELIERPDQAVRVAELNLQASNLVRNIAAFKAAFYYITYGIQILPKNGWQEQYDLALQLYVSGAEVAFVNGDLAHSESLARTAEEHARTLLERVGVMRIYMDIYAAQTQLDRVIELGIAAARLLEFDLEIEKPTAEALEKFTRLPDMTDPRALVVSRLIEPLITASYARNLEWFTRFVYFYIDLFSRFGNPPEASFVYIAYGVIVLSQFKHMEQGIQIGQQALELAEKRGPSRILYAVRFVYYAFFHHWLAPASEAVTPLEENIQSAFEAGNREFSVNSQDLALQNSLLAGFKLEQVHAKQVEALQRMEMRSQKSQRLVIWGDVIQMLFGEPFSPQEEYGQLYNEQEETLLTQASQNQVLKFNLYTAQAFASLFFRRAQRAAEYATKASESKPQANTHLLSAQLVFLQSLALLSPGLDPGDLAARLKQVYANLQLLRMWTALVPQNFLHQQQLVEAELARVLGHDEQVARSYEQAIQNARRNGFIQDSALAAELAAEYFFSRSEYTAGIDHLCTAYYSYQAWGAAAKVADLVNRYPNWLPPGKEIEQQKADFQAERVETDQLGSSIDLSTILKASLELAQETSLEVLLRKMMAILIENTGAQNGSLILVQNDRWFLRVHGTIDPEQGFSLHTMPLESLSPQAGKPYIPNSIIHYVINLKVPLVLEDASASRQFNRDAYIQTRRPRSVLCAPLLNQGALVGVVYLENNLIPGAFTSSRLEMIQLLSAQAAASIEKARLYETLEVQVEARTRDLSDANRRLKEEIRERIRVEEALRLSEARYRTVFENTGTAMAVIDEDGSFALVNEKYVELTGYSRKELEDQSNSPGVVTLIDLSRLQELRQAADPQKTPSSFEFELVDKSGKRKTVIVTTALIPGTTSTVASLIDITQRKSVEEALRYNEALLRRVLEILPVGIWILDKDTRIIKGNPEALRIWSGAKFVEWSEFSEYKAWRLETGERVEPGDWAAARAIVNGESILDEELEIEAFDGTHRIILNSAIPLETEHDGLIGAIAINQDITERKRSEEELQAAHDQLSTLLEISQSIVSTLDLDRLLNLIIEQLGKVMPYEAAAILMLEQNHLGFRVLRGPSEFQSLAMYQIPVLESAFIENVVRQRQEFYLHDLQSNQELLSRIQETLAVPPAQIAFLRTWLGLPLIAKDNLVGFLVLADSKPDAYSLQARLASKAYANQVAIAIHNAQLYLQAGDSAALEERNRLARELHDSVAQALYSISLFIDATRMALRTNKPHVVEEHLEELTQLSREAMSDMRLMIFELRPPVLEQIGLAAALQSRLDSVEARAGFRAEFQVEGEFRLSADQEIELYRIAQEGLNNIIKHAQADRVSVRLIGESDRVWMSIEDDGVGFDTGRIGQGGQGLRNIRERASRIGAVCTLESIPDQGTKITVELKQ